MTAKRGKRNLLLWVFVGIAAAGVSGLLFQWLRPSPPIRVSPQTTYLTTPLRGDGLPDYKLAQLQRLGRGVSPEENAAILFWQAMGRGDWDQADWMKLGRELGFAPAMSDQGLSGQFGEMRKAVQGWVAVNYPQLPAEALESLVYEVLERCQAEPWQAAECPTLAAVIARYEPNYELLQQAALRPGLYSPPLTQSSADFGVDLTMALREMIRALGRRASLRIGEGDLEGAWTDLRTALVLGSLPRCDLNIDVLIQNACEGAVYQQLRYLVASKRVSPFILRDVIHVLDRLPHPMVRLKGASDGERLFAIAWVIENQADPAGFQFDEWTDFQSQHLLRGSVDWNVTLEKINASYDQLNQILAASDRKTRWDQLQAWHDRLEQDQQDIGSPWVQAIGYVDPGKRSRIVADDMNSTSMSSYPQLLAAVERAATERELFKVAVNVRLNRLSHGHYPQRLEDLVPTVFTTLPLDGGYGLAIEYRRLAADAFLLYSLGPNGRDDEGSDKSRAVYRGTALPGWLAYANVVDDADRAGRFFEKAGEPLPADLRDPNSWIAPDADDISWRTPLPPEPLEELVKHRVAELAADENSETVEE